MATYNQIAFRAFQRSLVNPPRGGEGYQPNRSLDQLQTQSRTKLKELGGLSVGDTVSLGGLGLRVVTRMQTLRGKTSIGGYNPNDSAKKLENINLFAITQIVRRANNQT